MRLLFIIQTSHDAADIELENRTLLTEPCEGDLPSHSHADHHAGDDEKVSSKIGDVRDSFINDPFSPFDALPEENENILTLRAIAVGVACGALVNASNIYLGLKSGSTMSANLFAVKISLLLTMYCGLTARGEQSILGFALLKKCPEFLKGLPFLGSDFGPRENNIVQTAVTAAGGMSNLFNSAFPAMYQLGLLESPAKDFWRLVTLTVVGGYFGLLVAAPRRWRSPRGAILDNRSLTT